MLGGYVRRPSRSLWPANSGPNRLQMFVRVSAEVCTAAALPSFTVLNTSNSTASPPQQPQQTCEPGYDDAAHVVKVWLAPLDAPEAVVREVAVRPVRIGRCRNFPSH